MTKFSSPQHDADGRSKKAKSDIKKSTEERRKYMRFSAPMDVEYRSLTLNPIFGKALAKDLSREGMRFSVKDEIPVGTTLEISLNMPGDNLPVFATGKVAWADGLEAGLRLTKISPKDRARVLEHVYKEWLKKNKDDNGRNAETSQEIS